MTFAFQTARNPYYSQALQNIKQVVDSANYSPFIYPLTGFNATLNVSAIVLIYKLLELTNDKRLRVAMEVDLRWYDPNIPGNWSNLQNYAQLNIDTSLVWNMNLYLLNPASADLYMQPTSLTYLFMPPVGTVGAIVQENIISEFAVICQSMSLVNFPFDSQTCTMEFIYYDGFAVNFEPNGLPQLYPNADNGEWQMDNVTWGNASSLLSGGLQIGLAVSFSLTRNSYYYVVFLIIPTILLQAVAMLTFVLPSDHGEKVALAAALILGVNVLLTSLNVLIPQVQPDEVPKILSALKAGFFMTAVSLFESVLIQTIRIVASDLPESVHQSIDRYVSFNVFTCRKPKPKRTTDVERHVDDQTSDLNLNVLSTIGNSRSSDLSNEVSSKTSTGQLGRSNFANGPVPSADCCTSCNNRATSLQRLETLEKIVLELLASSKHEEAKQQVAERSWRKVEYVINFVMLVIYAAVFGYYFGEYISSGKI